MKTSTIVLIVIAVLVVIGIIVAVVMLNKPKQNDAANTALAGALSQPIVAQGGALAGIGTGLSGLLGGLKF